MADADERLACGCTLGPGWPVDVGRRSSGCDLHVGCDQACQALEIPVTPETIRAAYEHWSGHGYLNGCAHGC